MRGFEPGAFSGAMVEVVYYGLDVTVGDGIEGHFLRKELADHEYRCRQHSCPAAMVGRATLTVSTSFRSAITFVLGNRLASSANKSAFP